MTLQATPPLSGQREPVVSAPATATEQAVAEALAACRAFHAGGRPRDLSFRQAQLAQLKRMIVENADAIIAALKEDLGRPALETVNAEINLVLDEINVAQRRLPRWAKPKRVAPHWLTLPSRAQVMAEPLGVALIIGPWNYPFQLLVAPLVGAIAAGNCAVLKPSELAPATSAVVADLCSRHFDPSYIRVFEGGIEVSQALLARKFDTIFFTGGSEVGRHVMRAAAEHLTPVTLELGGKSPCIVEPDVDFDVTARRIVWGKFMNAGQTCVAPDYVLVRRECRARLVAALEKHVRAFYGPDPSKSPDYARIINDRHFQRLVGYLASGTAVVGGQHDRGTRYIAPTIIEGVSWDSAVMKDEIFGPILPVVAYDALDEALRIVNERPKPLALYVFARDEGSVRRVLNETSSGGVCVNDTVLHLTVHGLPFGGVGDSGMGRYHGVHSFETFSHRKAVLRKPFWLDVKLRYAPYADSTLRLMKRIFGLK